MTVGDWPLVSVVVPTMDRPELLRRAVVSILTQDYPGEIECLVVFDGTEPVLPEVDVPPRRSLRAMSNNRRKGLAGNRNTGYLAAQGVYAATCDDDDEWLPGKIRAQVELLNSRPDASVSATGIIVRYIDHDAVRRAPDRDLVFNDFLADRHMEVHPSAFVFRRELLGPDTLVDEELPGGYAEDYEWLLRMARGGPVVCVPEAHTIVHWHDGSFFTSRWVMIDQALTHLLREVPEFATVPAGLARIEGQLAFANAAMGERKKALSLAGRSLRNSRRVPQTYAAVLVACHLISADRVVTLGRRFGRGI
jgi:GT2 family glycosyltransferase